MLLHFALRDFGEFIGQNFGHFFIGQANAQNVERIFGRLAVGQFLPAVFHFKQIHIVGVAKTAHALTNASRYDPDFWRA